MLATPNALRRPDANFENTISKESIEIDEEEGSSTTSPHYVNDHKCARIGINKSDTSLNVLNGLDIANSKFKGKSDLALH